MTTKLDERLIKNYHDEIIDYLKYLKTKGFIITNDSVNGDYISQYHVYKSRFMKVCETNEYFEKLISPNVKDFYQIHLDGNFLENALYNTLDKVPGDELDNYTVYEKYESELIDESELKDELKDLQRLAKGVKFDKDDFMNPKNQVNYLVSQLIVFTGDCNIGSIYDKNAFFKFDGRTFMRVQSEEIHKMLIDGFKVNRNSIHIRDVEYNMRNTYRGLFNASTLPVRWRNNQNAIARMKEFRKDYLKVKQTIDGFI